MSTKPAICNQALLLSRRYFDQVVSSALCDFSMKLYHKFSSSPENIFFSPFSISVAMSMLLRGAQKETADEIRQLLCYDDVTDDELHMRLQWFFSLVEEKKEYYTLEVANALIHEKKFDLLTEYKTDLEKIYNATTLEFNSNAIDKTVVTVNDWVKTKTQGVIPKLLDRLDPLTVVILLSAVYFKGPWVYKFDSKRTREREFFNNGRESKNVRMMNITEEFRYAECESYQAVELPYNGYDVFMLILLPRERDGLPLLEKNLDKKFLNSVIFKLQPTRVRVTLPKFRLEHSKNLKEVFYDLGVTKSFDRSQADFRGLSNSDDLEVAEVVHKAVINVDEEGTEAAAATAVMMTNYCAVLTKRTPDFVADHPFVFVLHHQLCEYLLFMGRVSEL